MKVLAIDTNILLRYIVRNNPEQADIARKFIESLTPESPGFISREVALEFVWVLERSYSYPRVKIADTLLRLTSAPNIIVESEEDVVNAVTSYRQSSADFSDLLILAAAQRIGASSLYTFDHRLSRLQGATLLTAS